ncbi:MAG: trypsin-like peptidase domain-containing protein [Chthoniobacterales bacterium]|nr:trypsin-like peptidase domain-containing protein [Chthoniobacterales bacterium]
MTESFPYQSELPPSRGSRRRQATRWVPLLLGLVLGFLLYRQLFGPGSHARTPRPVTPRGDLAQDEKSTIELFQKSSPSVVFITTLRIERSLASPSVIAEGTGSGFIWDTAGHVVTNYHVIAGLKNVGTVAQVTLSDRKSYDAEVVGIAPKYDLALLKIPVVPGVPLQPLPIGTSADLLVGQKVFAIGDPFGLDQTLTTGIVSALGRTIQGVGNRAIEDAIQTDAAINPGNSGGPLLDSAGRLIGINTAIFSPSGGNAGIGFAVPVDTVNRIIPQLITHRKVIRPYTGMQFIDSVSELITQQMGVTGALVIGVEPNSPAATAGLRGTRRLASGQISPGDVVVEADGRPVNVADEIDAVVERHEAGDVLKLKILRDGKGQNVQLKLDPPRE